MLIVGFTFLSIRIFLLLWDVITDRADGFRHADEARDSMEIVRELKEGEVKI
jgi:C4-dicarboxylate transporter DctQ subunit